LTSLELGLLGSAYLLVWQHQSIKPNFEQIFHLYNDFTNKKSSKHKCSRDLALLGIGKLIDLSLLVPLHENVGREFQSFQLTMFKEEVENVFKSSPNVYTSLQKWVTDWTE
jgi:hypothetical protein